MKKRLIIIFLVILLINIFIFSNYIISNIYQYSFLFIRNLFFYTFIIYIISSLLIDNDLLEILNPISFVTIMSMISGFPSGIKYSKDLLDKGYINEDCANYLVSFCHFPNPLFITGSVSKIIGFNNSILILLSIYISSFITSRILKRNFNIKTNYIYKDNNIGFMNSLNKAIINSFKTILIIYGTSIISLIFVLIIIKIFKPTGLLYCVITLIFDLTKGIFSTTLIHNKRIRLYLILIFITFGSLNIHLQSKSICGNKINYKYFLIGRIMTRLIILQVILLKMMTNSI